MQLGCWDGRGGDESPHAALKERLGDLRYSFVTAKTTESPVSSASYDLPLLKRSLLGFAVSSLSTPTLFRRMLTGEDRLPTDYWTLYYSLPFSLRASMPSSHKATGVLHHVKGKRRSGDVGIQSFSGTVGDLRSYLRRALTSLIVFVEDVNLKPVLKRSGRTPPRATPRSKKVVRNIRSLASSTHRRALFRASAPSVVDDGSNIVYLGRCGVLCR